MNEELEYAKMLEIPVSTVSLVKKPRKQPKADELPPAELRDKVISKVNEKLSGEPAFSEPLPAVETDDILEEYGERVDTVQIYPSQKKRKKGLAEWFASKEEPSFEESEPQEEPAEALEEPLVLPSQSKRERREKIILTAELAAAVALCGGIFLTNALLPNSAVNTFFSALFTQKQTDTRVYTDFKLDSVVGDLSSAELSLSDEGVLTFTQKGCVYSAVDGEVKEVVKKEDGKYDLILSYSNSFTGVLSGLDYVYYEVGQSVFSNVPVGYSNGEAEVQATMFWNGELLNCFELTEENCLTWTTQNENA